MQMCFCSVGCAAVSVAMENEDDTGVEPVAGNGGSVSLYWCIYLKASRKCQEDLSIVS